MELAKGVRYLILFWSMLLVLTIVGCATKPKNQMTAGDSVAHEFRDNVVKITAWWKDGTKHEGFGFIVGERASQVYVATANHVLRDISPGTMGRPYSEILKNIAQRIEVQFFVQPDRPYSAQLIGKNDRNNDVGAVIVQKPSGMSWHKNVIAAGRAERGVQVRYVGKSGVWEIPATPGVVKGQAAPWFEVENLNILPGTSGAPLLSDRGVVGMVISDSQNVTRGLPVQTVADILKPHLQWQLLTKKVEEQDESSSWGKIAGGVLGAVAVIALIVGAGGGSTGGEQSIGTINVTAPAP